MKNKKINVLAVFFVFVLFCNLYAQQNNNLNKAVFRFDVSDSDLTLSEQDTIKRMAQKVSCLKLKVLIESNTDITGSDEINVPLSQKRADVVKNYFISLGVPEEDIQTISYVGTNPINDRRTPDAFVQNRRTEITLIDPEKDKFPRIIK